MYYELYVDVLFLVNFFMDYILLLFVWRILHCDTGHKRLVLGAALGALLTCILVILPITSAFLEFVLFHLVVNTCMIRVGLKIKRIPVFLKALILLYIGAFFMGGILESFHQYVKVGSLFLALAIVGYYLALGMCKFLARLQNWNSHYVTVELSQDGHCVEVRALVDTGNGLFDPLTGKPVSVVDKETAKKIIGGEMKMIRYIPYQSIGKKNGAMPVFYIDKMCVLCEERRCFEKPLLGISEEDISAGGKYEMILNPNLF